MNTITIHGNVGKTPELEFTPSQMAIAEFTVCSTHGKDDKKTDTWFNVKAFGKLAENICNSINKGDTVLITGRMETREYTKKDGTTSKWTTLVADEVAVSLRWSSWVRDQTKNVVERTGKVGRPMPKPSPVEDPF